MEKALFVKPMAKLPSALVPSGIYTKSRPPKFHYGWVLSDPDPLLDVARKLNIPPRDRSDSETSHSGEEEDIPSVSMTDVWMRDDALDAVAKILKLRCTPYVVTVFSPGSDSDRAEMISLIENYTLRDGLISRSDVPKLQEYFDFEDSPMWHLDTYRWTWNSDRFWNSE